jgi:BirA family transcriptional regulator, biotin operon repressor / biotin---[acetyl-CoA-carboxylase] ligase
MEFPKSSTLVPEFEHLETVDSTNAHLARRLITQPLPEFSVVTAEFQSSGRGRSDRSWQAEPGSSIMASVLLRPTMSNPDGLGWLTLVMALAIAKTIRTLGPVASIKWPNDVLIEGKKVCGILAEASPDLKTVIVGFGLNVNQSDPPIDGATSLFIETNQALDRDEILAAVLGSFQSMVKELYLSAGNAKALDLFEEISKLSSTIGEQVQAIFPDGSRLIGLATGLDESGRLIIESFSGHQKIAAADIVHLRPS